MIMIPQWVFGLNKFSEKLNIAQLAYDQFHIEDAITSLEEAFKTNDLKSIPLSELQRAYVLLALGYITKNSEALAKKAFLNLLDLDPAYLLSKSDFSPKIYKVFEQSKSEFFNDSYFISISSRPLYASVVINGEEKGFTPLTEKLSRYEDHRLELKLQGYEVVSEPFPKNSSHQLLKRDISLKKVFVAKTEKLESTQKAPQWLSLINPLDKKDTKMRRFDEDNVLSQDLNNKSSLWNNGWLWLAAGALVAVGSYVYLNQSQDSQPGKVVYEDKTQSSVRIIFP